MKWLKSYQFFVSGWETVLEGRWTTCWPTAWRCGKKTGMLPYFSYCYSMKGLENLYQEGKRCEHHYVEHCNNLFHKSKNLRTSKLPINEWNWRHFDCIHCHLHQTCRCENVNEKLTFKEKILIQIIIYILYFLQIIKECIKGCRWSIIQAEQFNMWYRKWGLGIIFYKMEYLPLGMEYQLMWIPGETF